MPTGPSLVVSNGDSSGVVAPSDGSLKAASSAARAATSSCANAPGPDSGVCGSSSSTGSEPSKTSGGGAAAAFGVGALGGSTGAPDRSLTPAAIAWGIVSLTVIPPSRLAAALRLAWILSRMSLSSALAPGCVASRVKTFLHSASASEKRSWFRSSRARDRCSSMNGADSKACCASSRRLRISGESGPSGRRPWAPSIASAYLRSASSCLTRATPRSSRASASSTGKSAAVVSAPSAGRAEASSGPAGGAESKSPRRRVAMRMPSRAFWLAGSTVRAPCQASMAPLYSPLL